MRTPASWISTSSGCGASLGRSSNRVGAKARIGPRICPQWAWPSSPTGNQPEAAATLRSSRSLQPCSMACSASWRRPCWLGPPRPRGGAQFAHRQPAGGGGHAAFLALAPALFDGLQRQLAQAVLAGPLDAEGFVAGQRLFALRQAQAEALLQQVARRVFEAVDQLAGFQAQRIAARPVCIRRGQGAGEGRRRFDRLAQALGGAEPGRGETGLCAAGEIAGGEGLQRVLVGDVDAGFWLL